LGEGIMLNVFREETMAFMLVPLNLTLIKYPVRSHLPINNDFIYITMQLSLRRNCILKHDHVWFFLSFLEDNPNIQERF
jgi:hypothetical protein